MNDSEFEKKLNECSTNEQLDQLLKKVKSIDQKAKIQMKRKEINTPKDIEKVEEIINEEGEEIDPFTYMKQFRNARIINNKWQPNADESNDTAFPNVLFDYFFPALNEDELKILLYVGRHTTGYGKSGDFIAIKQILDGIPGIDVGAGIQKRESRRADEVAVSRVVKRLERAGFIMVYRGLKASDKDKYSTNRYKLNLSKIKTFKFKRAL